MVRRPGFDTCRVKREFPLLSARRHPREVEKSAGRCRVQDVEVISRYRGYLHADLSRSAFIPSVPAPPPSFPPFRLHIQHAFPWILIECQAGCLSLWPRRQCCVYTNSLSIVLILVRLHDFGITIWESLPLPLPSGRLSIQRS